MITSIKVSVLLSIFFLPYLYGTQYRMDVLFELFSIIILIIQLLLGKINKLGASIKKLILLSVLPLCYLSLRLAVDFDFNSKVLVYQIHFLGGIAIYVTFKNFISKNSLRIFAGLLLFSILINLYPVIQWNFESYSPVSFLLELYGGLPSEDYTGELPTLAAHEVMHKSAMTSIFTGKHTLAQFSLLIAAVSVSVFNMGKYRLLAVLAFICAGIGGVLSFSKIFLFGFPLLLLIISARRMSLIKLIAILATTIMIVVLVEVITPLLDSIYVLQDVFIAILNGDVFSLIESRFGEDGYLTEANFIFYEPITWMWGQGAAAGLYRMADNQYRSILLLGGVIYFIAYLAPIIMLSNLLFRRDACQKYLFPLFSYSIVIFIAGIGVEVFWQPRIVSLWVVICLAFIDAVQYNHLTNNNASHSPPKNIVMSR